MLNSWLINWCVKFPNEQGSTKFYFRHCLLSDPFLSALLLFSDPQPSLAHTWPHSKSSSGCGQKVYKKSLPQKVTGSEWNSILPRSHPSSIWTSCLPPPFLITQTLGLGSSPFLLQSTNSGLCHWCLACLSLPSSPSWT